MRIAIMLRTFDEKGGVAVYSRNLVETLLEADPRNEYALLYRNPEHLGLYANRPRVSEHLLTAPNKALWDQWAVPRACRRLGADLILHPKFTVPLVTRCPTLMVLHGADWFLPDAAQFYAPLDRAYMRVFMPLYLRKAAVALSVSQLTTDDFNRIFNLPPGKVRTVYFGPARHFRRITDPAAIATVRAKYGLPERFIFSLAKPDGGERKNVRGVFESYARVHGQVPHKLVMGGRGLERFRDDYAIPADGWGRDVVFPGYLDQVDLPAIYSAADLYLYPSNQEAFPIPLTEAMACGTPIVTSRVNGLAEIAGDAALLVDQKDPDDIAAAMLRVLREPAVAARLSAMGLERARTFSWAACARRTLEILEEVGGRRAAAPASAAGRP